MLAQSTSSEFSATECVVFLLYAANLLAKLKTIATREKLFGTYFEITPDYFKTSPDYF